MNVGVFTETGDYVGLIFDVDLVSRMGVSVLIQDAEGIMVAALYPSTRWVEVEYGEPSRDAYERKYPDPPPRKAVTA